MTDNMRYLIFIYVIVLIKFSIFLLPITLQTQRIFLIKMVKAKKWILTTKFDGFPKDTDVQLVEEDLPPLKDGEFLAEAVFLSVDPYMRKYVDMIPLNSTIIGTQVAIIKESKNGKFPVGKYVTGQYGWRSHTISNGDSLVDLGVPVTLLPDLGDLPLSSALGVFGMPGNTAYFGFLDICEPKPEETVVVSGAAGAVGSLVGQIAKIKGCKVIGIAGSDQKGEILTKELGFDHFINYKTQDVAVELKKVAPQGIDCYFDNVGGEMSNTVMRQMNTRGRICACGSISGYNEKISTAAPCQMLMVFKELLMVGLQVVAHKERWDEGFKQNFEWVKQGKLKYKETVTEGFENMYTAFTDMLSGANMGKAIVKV